MSTENKVNNWRGYMKQNIPKRNHLKRERLIKRNHDKSLELIFR